MLLALARTLIGRGAAVDLLVPSPATAWHEGAPRELRLHELDGWWMRLPWLGTGNKRRIFLSPPALAGYLARERPDVLVAWSIPANLAALVAKRLAGGTTRIVARQSNVIHLAGDERYAGIAPRARDRWLSLLYPSADAVIAVSSGVAENLAALGVVPRERVHTIANGVPLDEVADKGRAAIDHPWFAAGAPPVALAVGRLVAKKDYPTLLRALARARAAADLRLMILGEGPERPRLEALARELGIADAVALAGFQPNPFAVMARARMLVLSSISEGMPSVVIEALASGLPVVATDCPSGPAEILAGGAYGDLVPIGDDAALAAAMLASLERPSQSARLRARAAEFSLESAASRYADAITTVLPSEAAAVEDR